MEESPLTAELMEEFLRRQLSLARMIQIRAPTNPDAAMEMAEEWLRNDRQIKNYFFDQLLNETTMLNLSRS